ncbi:MAG: tetratricopeptide repeat protein [Acidobacteriota bacterium]|nr:tetratricopeptide repeat protein [Acidobacteriota bacterium]MDH3523882.1 tetratricopeptide repeat protein [Acidobacteriota bacterium]
MSAPSLAVLPFADLSANADQRTFCDGLAAELIAALARIEGLRVVPRGSSLRLRAVTDAADAGRRLEASTVLEGSVDKADGRLRVSVKLTASADGAELWSATFDRPLGDVFAIQHEIAKRIAHRLELRLDARHAEAPERPPTADLQAYEHYLEGRERFFEYRRQGVEAALRSFDAALALDPDYARAHAGVAECRTFLFMYADGDAADLEQADLASRRALELAPDLAEAHVARGLVLSLQRRYAESEEAFETAIGLDPRLYEAYYFYARNAFVQGDLESAEKLFGHASRIDPDDFQAPLLVAQIHDDLGRSQHAAASRRRGIRAAERRLEHNPEEARALYMGANALVSLGQTESGLRWAERALALEPDEPMVLYNVGCVFSLAGELDRALDCVEQSVKGGLAYIDWLRQDSNLDAIRDHPRFQALLG